MPIPEEVGDERFFARSGPYTVAQVAEAAGGTVGGTSPEAGARLLTGVAPVSSAATREVCFLDNRRYVDALSRTSAGAAIVHPDLAGKVPPGTVAIVTTEPYLGWARTAALFHPEPPSRPGIHGLSSVDPAARVDSTAEIGPFVVIGPAAEIGPGCRIGAGSVIGGGVKMGRDCRIGAHVTLSHAILGDRVRLFPGARVGQDGFGFAATPTGFRSIPQLGRVILEDDVEVGANSTIDRGAGPDTVIGAGTRLDNLVQIGHNVRVGRCCVIVAQVGISGSTTVGDFVQIAGQAGLVGHLRIGSRSRIGGQAGVMADVPDGTEVVGSPAMPVRSFFRQVAALRRLAERGRGTGTDQSDASRRGAAKSGPGQTPAG